MNKFFADKLLTVESIQCNPRGNSMKPKIFSGQKVTISSDIKKLEKGDIVFCKVKGKYFIHLISAIRGDGENMTFQISNNHGHINGWIGKKGIFGKVTKVE